MPVSIVYRIEDGKLVVDGLGNEIRLEAFLKGCKDGTKLEITLEEINSSGSYAQLAKIHACLRELSRESGHSVDELKKFVKDKAGLYSKPGELRSLGDASKAELSSVIQIILELGDSLNCNLHTT